ncbi:hypothetical protein ACHAQJ_009931 [Trichoderma viride]
MPAAGAGIRGTKRSAPEKASDCGKKRHKYASQACEACRKRKGKCDGQQPCEYCWQHKFLCMYSGSGNDSHLESENLLSNEGQGISEGPNASSSLVQLVASLQEQVGNLADQVRQFRTAKIPDTSFPLPSPQEEGSSNVDAIPAVPSYSSEAAAPLPSRSNRTEQRFYGPSSAEYTLNVARMKLHRSHGSQTTTELFSRASIDVNQTNEDDYSAASGVQQGTIGREDENKLLRFRTILSKQNALYMLRVYREVVDDFHPIVNIDALERWAEWCYSRSGVIASGAITIERSPAPSDNDLLILNLALVIAICAESTLTGPEMVTAIYSNCQDLIYTKLMSPAPKPQYVRIALLVSIVYFFKDNHQHAWRICGLAGRMAMQLGLHIRDVSRQLLTDEQQRAENNTLTLSIFILDRQWGTATGLPNQFQWSDFEQELEVPGGHQVKVPYIRGMISFIRLSEEVSEAISKITKNGGSEDNELVEVMDFRIDQWRKKALGHDFIAHISLGQFLGEDSIPTWAVVLYLRANSMKGSLLRPLFSTKAGDAVSYGNIELGIKLVLKSIGILYTLMKTTDIYRKQRPYLQYVLASSCALLFLIVAYIKHSQSSSYTHLLNEFTGSISGCLRKGFEIAETYSNSSSSAQQLWKKFMLMKKLLEEVGIILQDSTENVSNAGFQQRALVNDSVGSFTAPRLSLVPSVNMRHLDAAFNTEQLPSSAAFPISMEDNPILESLATNIEGVEWLSQDWLLHNRNNIFPL